MLMKEKKIVTRKHVAEKADVSLAVVSRVLNNSGYVESKKRERVRKIAKELGYNPNPVALSLKKNRTKQLLYYVRDMNNYYYMDMYKGMSDYAASKGYVFILGGYLDAQRVGALMVDGILLPSEFETGQDFLENIHVPVVAATYGAPINTTVHTVDADVETAVQVAIDHLRQLGHRRIAFISYYTSNSLDPRLGAFEKIMSGELGARLNDYILGVPEAVDPTKEVLFFELGEIASQQFLERRLDATAIVCFNDDMAISAMSYLQQAGYSIPGDISIIGIDGHIGGKYSSPPLTTVCINPREHGKQCARMLIRLIEGKDVDNETTISSSLIVRKSTDRIR